MQCQCHPPLPLPLSLPLLLDHDQNGWTKIASMLQINHIKVRVSPGQKLILYLSWCDGTFLSIFLTAQPNAGIEIYIQIYIHIYIYLQPQKRVHTEFYFYFILLLSSSMFASLPLFYFFFFFCCCVARTFRKHQKPETVEKLKNEAANEAS